jgi:type II secretory pathway pseudopilin PulG
MPEFEMPPELPGTAASPALTAEAEPAAVSGSPDGAELEGDGPPPRSAARRRLVAGAVLAALAIVGVSTAAIVQGVQRAVEHAATEAVSAVALDYLSAIAEGRGDAATALVPVDGPAPLLTDAALADAGRIQAFRVEGVELAGDAATVDVAFRTGQGRVVRELGAVQEGGAWRLTTTLAERVVLDAAISGPLPRYLDTDIGGGEGTLLYPAMYRIEPVVLGLVHVGPTTLVVDGDPSTATPRSGSWSIADGVLEGALERALAHAVACRRGDSCPVPSDALLGAAGSNGYRIGADGAVEHIVPIQVLAGGAGLAQVWVAVRASVDAAGGIDWQCSGPVGLDSSGQIPDERAWEACA